MRQTAGRYKSQFFSFSGTPAFRVTKNVCFLFSLSKLYDLRTATGQQEEIMDANKEARLGTAVCD